MTKPLALSLLCLSACSLLTSLDDLGSGGGDGGQPNDAGGGDAGANLVPNGSFDQGNGGCGVSWGNGYNMTFMSTSPGRTGSNACLVCIQPTASGSYGLDLLTPISVPAGSYYAEAWLTTPDGSAPTPAGILISYDVDGGVSGCGGIGQNCQGSFFDPPTGSWAVSTATFLVTGTETLHVEIHSYGGDPGTCYVVDDVALYAQ